jgi:hypothetical protein
LLLLLQQLCLLLLRRMNLLRSPSELRLLHLLLWRCRMLHGRRLERDEGRMVRRGRRRRYRGGRRGRRCRHCVDVVLHLATRQGMGMRMGGLMLRRVRLQRGVQQ